jgi:hypothetical protein
MSNLERLGFSPSVINWGEARADVGTTAKWRCCAVSRFHLSFHFTVAIASLVQEPKKVTEMKRTRREDCRFAGYHFTSIVNKVH